MKIFSSPSYLFATAGCILALAASSRAADFVRYKAKPVGSTVRIDGAANIHDWEMEGTLITGYLEIPASVTLDSTQAAVAGAADGKLAAQAEIGIPVTSILNAKYSGMSEVMQQAMNAADHPRIEYHLTEMTLKQPHTAGTPFQFDAKGQLTLNGVTNAVSFPVTIENADKGKLKITAAAIPVKMTDYGIKPPVKAGLFITEPDVKISFTWIVGMSTSKPAEAK